MNFYWKLFLFFLAVNVFSVQADELRLCVLVDGSKKMVNEKSFDDVLSALDTKILDVQKQQSREDAWSVEIVAVGVTKKLFGNTRFFQNLPLYPCPPGVGLDTKKKNNRIPNITDESPLTCAEVSEVFSKFVADKAIVYNGVVVITDQPNVNMLSNEGKYHKNILLELEKAPGSIVPSPNRMKLVNDIKTAFDGFSEYVREQKKPPVVSAECLEKATIYVGMPVRFKVKGTDLDYAVVNYGAGTPVLKIAQNEIDRIVEYTYAAKGKFSFVVQGVRGAKEANTNISVNVVEKPPYPVVEIVVLGAKHYVGEPVKFQVNMVNVTEAVVDFGDKSELVKKAPTTTAQEIGHVYAKPGNFTVGVKAQGEGGAVNKSISVLVHPLPTIDIAIEPSGNTDGEVVAIPQAEFASAIEIDFGDKVVLPGSHGQSVTHKYAKAGQHLIRMTVTRQGKDETIEKEVLVKLPPPPPLSALELRVEKNGMSVVVTPKAEKASSIEVDFGAGSEAIVTTDRQPVSYTYKNDGDYTVTMSATRAGKVEKKSEDVTIETKSVSAPPSRPKPKAEFVLETSSAGELLPQADGTYSVKRGELIDFVNKSKNAQKFRWVLGDTTAPITDRSVSYVYKQDGMYEVMLTAYGEDNLSDMRKVSLTVKGGNPLIPWLLFLVTMLSGLGWVALWLRKPELAVVLSINGQDGNMKPFSLLGHRVSLSELSVPLECRARKNDGIWMVEFRALEERVLEKRPSLTPIRLEAKTWTQPINSGEFVMAGNANEVIKIQES